MRILILSQYFDPEPFFKGLPFATEMMRQGHSVEVLTGYPNYPGGKLFPGYRLKLVQREIMDGVRVIRVPLYPSHDRGGFRRMANYLSFAIAASILGPRVVSKPDVIYAYHGHAPIGLPAIIIGFIRRAPFILDIQDLWPDSVTSSGMLPQGLKRLFPLLEIWCRLLYRRASAIAVLSSGFKRTLESRGVPPEKIVVIHNWCDERLLNICPIRADEEFSLKGRFNIVIAGNVGTVQGLGIIIEASKILAIASPQVQFVIVGDGVDRPNLERLATSLGLKNILFLPRRPIQEIAGLLHCADALLVHLKDDPLFAVTIPSRVQAYLAVGRPLLCGLRGDGAEMVQQAGAGICFEPENPQALASAVGVLLQQSPVEMARLAENGRTYYKQHLSILVGTRKMLSLFDKFRWHNT